MRLPALRASRTARAIAALLLAGAASACGSGGPSADGAPDPDLSPDAGPSPQPPPGPPGWAVAAREDFSADAAPARLAAAAFAPDAVPDDGPFADAGAFFQVRGVAAPAAFRATQAFGAGGWLTLEAYTRRSGAAVSEHAQVVPDPADPSNRVLRLSPRDHTDAVVVRPTEALPARYRISLRVGFPSFGDGEAGLNGYDGGERAGPWWPDDDATSQNGFYWLAILDHLPRPHNNTWIHHHRKVVVDSDNTARPGGSTSGTGAASCRRASTRS